MGQVFRTLVSLTAAAVSRSNRKKTLRDIKKRNDTNRRVSQLGCVGVDQLIPTHAQLGNLSVSGGTVQARNQVLVQNVRQACAAGVPVVVLHEGNDQLVQALGQVCANQCYFREINAGQPFYEPIFRLNDTAAIARMLVDSSLPGHKIAAGGALYIGAMCEILKKRGINPYLRMLAACPHGAMQEVLVKAEQAGYITGDEATALRNDLAAGAAERPEIEYFFSQLQAESDILAWKSHLSRSTSISECIKCGGVLCMDIKTAGRQTQLALLAAELRHCIARGDACRVIVDAAVLAGNEALIDLLKKSSQLLCWTLSTPDMGKASGTAKEELTAWLALAHKAILFSHGIHTAQQLSSELGEYEHIEVTQSHTGNNAIGQFGFHFGANNNVSTTHKRERVIKPEEIAALGDKEFIMLDNNHASLSKGSIA